MEKTYKDTSIFSGIAQYIDDCGQEWRRHNAGICWDFYRLVDGAFILEGSLSKPGGYNSVKTVKQIHGWFLDKQAELKTACTME